MKKAIKASFEQNPQALQKLLSTGDTELTHTQAKRMWRTEFPRILMEVREELAKEKGINLNSSSSTFTNSSNASISSSATPNTINPQPSRSNNTDTSSQEVTIEYTPKGKSRQTYTIRGNKIFNKEGKEVFTGDSVDRNKIFANLAVHQKRAVVVYHNGKSYVVNDRDQIISVSTGKIMQWEEENGDRKNILALAKEKFSAINAQPTVPSTIAPQQTSQFVTVAPYYRSKLTSTNKEAMIQATQDIQQKAQKLATELGLTIKAVKPAGGTYLGSSEISWVYEIESTDQKAVDLFASLMGDLSNEYQDAVIAANYVTDDSQATAIELTYTVPENTTIEDIENTLKEAGIEGSTFIFENNQLNIIAFDQEGVDKITKNLNNSNYEYKGYASQNSRYLDNESRRNTYKEWLNSEQAKQNRKLYNACSKALQICEEVAALPKGTSEEKVLETANNAAEKWDKDNLSPTNKVPSNSIISQLIEHLRSLGFNVKNRAEMIQYLKEHNIDYLQLARASRELHNSDLTVDEINKIQRHIESLPRKTDTSKGLYYIDKDSKQVYKFNTSLHQYNKNRRDGRDGFEILLKRDISDLDTTQLNKFENEYKQGRPIDTVLSRIRDEKGSSDSSIFLSEDRQSSKSDVRLDRQTLQGESVRRDNNSDSKENIKSLDGLLLFLTPQGEIYGFVDKEGNIYLDETVITSEHPIHEYTHLWDRIVAEKNPALWERGIALMKEGASNTWNDILNHEHYGKKWQSMGITGNRLDYLIASEVHSKLTGEHGKELIEEEAERSGNKDIISKLKAWLLDMWKELKKTFTDWSQEELNTLKLEDFVNMPIRDFLEGVDFNTVPEIKSVVENSVNNTPAGAPQAVRLPGYETYNNSSEATLVDAAWKIPLLQELDMQLSSDISEEEKLSISDRMTKILFATSEQEYNQQNNSNEKTKINETLDEYEKLIQQLNNLLDSEYFTATEVRKTAESIANQISDTITELQIDKNAKEKLFPEINTTLDFATATRKEIVEAIGINSFVEKALEIFEKVSTQTQEDFHIINQAFEICDNWDALMILAADYIAFNEGFSIVRDCSNKTYTTTEKSTLDYDNFSDYSNDVDVNAEEQGRDEQEHWQVESRTIDTLNSMSAIVRQAIHECYILDKDGNKVYDKWGIAERVNPKDAVNKILRWTQGTANLESMIAKLRNKKDSNPWVTSLITRLSDTTGKETDFQSQFYGVFTKHFQLYAAVLKENGKYYPMELNKQPAVTEAMDVISALYKMQQHPLFNKDGFVNKNLLGSAETAKTSKVFTLYKAWEELKEINKQVSTSGFTPELYEKTTANIVGVCRILGYPITEEMLGDSINAENFNMIVFRVGYLTNDLAKAAQHRPKNYNPFGFKTDYSIAGTVKNLLTPILEGLEETAVNAFYDSGKMYQSYVIPSYMTNLFNKFKLPEKEFKQWMEEEYANSEWFRSQEFDMARGWKSTLFRKLFYNADARSKFDHKVELRFNKHNYMRTMTDAEYTLSLITEYYSVNNSEKHQEFAWYRVPMQSNKPSSEFIKFLSFRGDGYKKEVVWHLQEMVNQELSRIQTVRKRNLSKNDPGFIENFDTRGREFCFFPVLNAYLNNDELSISQRNIIIDNEGNISEDNNRLAALLQRKVESVEETKLSDDEEAELNSLITKTLTFSTEAKVQSILNNWEVNGILEAAKSIKELGTKDEVIRDKVENFLWNDTLMSKFILQLTITDVAFYKDAENLQKRLSQLHAPGIRARVDARAYETAKYKMSDGRVSDGKYRTFILKDFDNFKSNIIANITEVFNRKIDRAPEDQKPMLTALRDDLVRAPGTFGENDKGGKYWNINVTDAQGYSSPTSYRKKAYLFGKWSREAESIYEKLQNGTYDYNDLKTAFQPLKPFVYSKLNKHISDNAPIKTMHVPFQAKNAEYLLIMADAILKGEELSRPNLLRAVYNVMEDSAFTGRERDAKGNIIKFGTYNGKGIDTVQFESAIKSGLQGKMDIQQYADAPGGEMAAYKHMMNNIYEEGSDNYNTREYVHELSFDAYCLQQEVPEHFKEHSQAHGSQTRMIAPSDLDYYYIDENGNQEINYYEWTEPDGKGGYITRKATADELKKEYEETIAESIAESIKQLKRELHLDSLDPKASNIALSKVLQREILHSPRYGIDLIQACSVDKNTGEFRIPKGDPIQSKRIEQFINSMIKNRINKQKIAGGPIVQVSNFGTSKQLHIRFKDKNGNILMTKEEYEASLEKSTAVSSQIDKFNDKYNIPGKKSSANKNSKTYEEYLKENQDGIAYFEVYAPIWSDELIP